MKKYKKLSIVISSYDDIENPVYAGGGSYAVHELAKGLAQKYKVTVLTGTYKEAKNELIDNVKYARIGSSVLGHKIGHLFFQYALLRYASRNDYDLWIESSTPPFTFSLLPLFSRKPVIIWINMLCCLDMRRKYKIDFEFIEHSLSKLYTHIIVPTDWVFREIKAMNKTAKVFMITQGIDVLKSPQPPFTKVGENGSYLLYIGRIEVDQKGLDLLLQALSITLEDVRLIIAGTGAKKEEDKLTDLISRYGVTKKVKRVGRVELSGKAILLKKAKAVIVPSRFETFSLSALESIIYQKPVICFDIPQLKWISEKYSVKIRPFSISQLAHSIDGIFSGKIKRRIKKKESAEILKKYNWDNSLQKFEEIIESLNI